MWHASVAPTAGQSGTEATLRRHALHALDGVGDRQYEWDQWTGVAYHLRRRLTAEEHAQVGSVRDVRGTPEAVTRYRRMAGILGPLGHRLAREELTQP